MGKQSVTAEPAAVYVRIESLLPWAKNPRKNDAAVDRVAESIRRFGFSAPIVARKADSQIIAGHTRLRAAYKLGFSEVPVRFLDLTEADAHLLALADNKLGELAEWDDAALGRVLLELKAEDADLLASGFDQKEVDEILAEMAADAAADVDEDPLPEPDTAPDSAPGQIYELGPHRLLCGDSPEDAAVRNVVGGKAVDLLWTDPPYNVDYEGKTKDALKIQNDSMDPEAFRAFLRAAFASADAVLRPGAVFYIAHADTEGENFRGAVRETGWKFAQCLIWVKDVFVMGRQDYHWRHEPILYGWKEGAGHHRLEDRTQDTVWEIPRPKKSESHPTTKPVELIARGIRNSSKAGDLVLDLFGGSGSTLIAAERCGRQAVLVEKDPRYCDVIRRRWDNYRAKVAAQ